MSVADHAADAAALLDHLGIRRAHIAGHSSGAAVALQLAIDFPEMVHSLSLLELSLLSAPCAKGLFEKAGPAFQAYAAADHETALAVFMSAVSGLEWNVWRKLLDERAKSPKASRSLMKQRRRCSPARSIPFQPGWSIAK